MADTHRDTGHPTAPLKEEKTDSLAEIRNDDATTGVGELNFEESTRGGLGRHLGVFSTIFLM